jgi:hypothetical protein
MLTRKHFNKLAAMIARTEDQATRARLTETVGQLCAEDNAQFDWHRWALACDPCSADPRRVRERADL